MKLNTISCLVLTATLLLSCDKNKPESAEVSDNDNLKTEELQHSVDQFADIEVLRYQVPG